MERTVRAELEVPAQSDPPRCLAELVLQVLRHAGGVPAIRHQSLTSSRSFAVARAEVSRPLRQSRTVERAAVW